MNGILIVDKPQDFTSFDVIAKLRGVLGQRRLGHGGTLDPMATGVLPVFCGAATRAVDILPDTTKRYTATVQLGLTTDTGDITGAVSARDDCRCTENQLRDALPKFIGAQMQTPPMYSAVKVDGKRLYELARAGKEVERAARPIEIFDIELLDFNAVRGNFVLDVRCSKGTYIRTLCEDIAAAVDCRAALAALRRTASAGFALEDARTMDDIAKMASDGRIGEWILPVDTAFSALPAVELDAALARLYLNGFRFECRRMEQPPEPRQTVRVYSGNDFLGLGQNEEGLFCKTRHFYEMAQE